MHNYDKEYENVYYHTHQEEKAVHCKRYRDKHKDELREQIRAYRKQHYYAGCDKADKESRRKYTPTPFGRASHLASGCNISDIKHIGVESTIDKEWVLEHILHSKCIFCGDDNWQVLKCDRVDYNLPHTETNTICACESCIITRNKMDYQEFMQRKLKRS